MPLPTVQDEEQVRAQHTHTHTVTHFVALLLSSASLESVNGYTTLNEEVHPKNKGRGVVLVPRRLQVPFFFLLLLPPRSFSSSFCCASCSFRESLHDHITCFPSSPPPPPSPLFNSRPPFRLKNAREWCRVCRPRSPCFYVSLSLIVLLFRFCFPSAQFPPAGAGKEKQRHC